MKKDPSSITVIGSSSPGSMDHLQFVRFAKAYGVDITKIKYVSEQDGGELTALLNGNVDVFSTGVADKGKAGFLGFIDANHEVIYYRDVTRLHTTESEFSKMKINTLPNVEIVYSYAGADGDLINYIVSLNCTVLM